MEANAHSKQEVDHCVIKDVAIDIPKKQRGRPPKVKPLNVPNNDELCPNETVDTRKDTKGKPDIYYFNYNVFRS
jgi:hypothetical protein